MIENNTKDETLKVNDLTSQDIKDFGKEVGKDTLKQAAVWTLAAGLTTMIRNLVSKITKGS